MGSGEAIVHELLNKSLSGVCPWLILGLSRDLAPRSMNSCAEARCCRFWVPFALLRLLRLLPTKRSRAAGGNGVMGLGLRANA